MKTITSADHKIAIKKKTIFLMKMFQIPVHFYIFFSKLINEMTFKM